MNRDDLQYCPAMKIAAGAPDREPFHDRGFRGWRQAGLSSVALIEVLDQVDAHEFGDDTFMLKRRRYQEIGKITAASGEAVAVKRWRTPLGLPRLTSPARRAARAASWLIAASVNTPLVLAELDRVEPASRRGAADSILVTQWCSDHVPMVLILAGHRPYERALRPWLAALGELAAQVHEGGVGHHDLRLENILAREGRTNSRADLVLVDLDEVVRRRLARRLRAARDLGNLVFHLRRLEIPDHTSRRILVYYARSSGMNRIARMRLTRRAFRIATLRAWLRSAHRITEWLPRLRARKSNVRADEKLRRVYGVEGQVK